MVPNRAKHLICLLDPDEHIPGIDSDSEVEGKLILSKQNWEEYNLIG